jgi:hypothetical protein
MGNLCIRTVKAAGFQNVSSDAKSNTSNGRLAVSGIEFLGYSLFLKTVLKLKSFFNLRSKEVLTLV